MRAWAGRLALVAGVLACQGGGPAEAPTPAALLRERAAVAGVRPLAARPADPPAMVALGRALFHDKVLSGSRDIACSTCHNLAYHTTDLLSLSIGTGGDGLAVGRQLGTGAFAARNAPELFNRGHPEWRRLFWDGRVEVTAAGLATPAGAALPPGLSGVLAAQVLFPMSARGEMRGRPGENPLADLPDSAFTAIWDGIVSRVVALPGYDTLAHAAFPGRDSADIGIADLANAVAAFIGTSWSFPDAPFDRLLAGEDAALAPAAIRGGLLFFGRARCATCHRGPLLTDQEFHNVGVPALGPGLAGATDAGRYGITGDPADRFAFRTPSLRNVAHSPPYMHNGGYRSLAEAVRHYRDVRAALFAFDTLGVDPRLRATIDLAPAGLAAITSTLDPLLGAPLSLSDADVDDLVAFLVALTDPRSSILLGDIPATVPSGLPVHDY